MSNNQENLKPVFIEDLGMHYATNKSKQLTRYHLFKCHCGKEFKGKPSDINSGRIKSCGCARRNFAKNLNKSHSLRTHRLYQTWSAMMNRCYNKKRNNYKYYGQCGVIVCLRWHNVTNFIEDMYPSFKEGLQIDRVDTNGDYEPSNCRWVNQTVQNINKKKQSNTTSQFIGVCFEKISSTWRAQITVNGVKKYLGKSKSEIEMALIRDKFILDNNLIHPLNFSTK